MHVLCRMCRTWPARLCKYTTSHSWAAPSLLKLRTERTPHLCMFALQTMGLMWESCRLRGDRHRRKASATLPSTAGVSKCRAGAPGIFEALLSHAALPGVACLHIQLWRIHHIPARAAVLAPDARPERYVASWHIGVTCHLDPQDALLSALHTEEQDIDVLSHYWSDAVSGIKMTHLLQVGFAHLRPIPQAAKQ